MFGRKPKVLLDLKTDPDIKVSGTFADYYTLLNKSLKYLQDILQQFKSKCLAMINKDFQYNSWRFSIYYLFFNKSVKNNFKESYYKICRTFSHL